MWFESFVAVAVITALMVVGLGIVAKVVLGE